VLGLMVAGLLGAEALAAEPDRAPLASPAFAEAYQSYYRDLAGFPAADLRLELTETVEDVLTSGSHLSRASVDYKRRAIEDALLTRAGDALCRPSPAVAATPERLREVCADATLAATQAAAVRLEAEELGMISAVCARIVATPSLLQWCTRP
jgi:hypothetical protein